ncbi:helix-turn-helix transcriptional regulator [Aquirufa nivalisilvae]|uniref:helix-turn-helix domain-containing protein n=1 Tax=Aquirufa nivalisilvae TaxID=2516557 RepID=UPI0022A9D5F6|nr:helix-turn-helix domain-containing protein [Aquirufa nivalisilvae]MCZ2482578.1 helix-turn-helix transcriptional regulator [Aquirufa nivalisilvae]
MILNLSFLGLVVALLLYIYREGRAYAKILLAIFYFLTSIFGIVHDVTNTPRSEFMISLFAVNFSPLYFLMGPVFFLFVKVIIGRERLVQKDWLHAGVAGIFLINILPHLFSSFDDKLILAHKIVEHSEALYEAKYLFLPTLIQSTIRPIFTIGYFLYTGYYLIKRCRIKNYFVTHKVSILWIGLIIILYIFLNTASLLVLLNNLELQKTQQNWLSPMMLQICFDVKYWVYSLQNLSILFIPYVLFSPQYKKKKHTSTRAQGDLVLSTFAPPVKRVVTSTAYEVPYFRLEEIGHQIAKYCVDEPYLRSRFSLSMIAEDTKIPYYQLSYYFNNHLGVSFNDWKNELRVKHIITLIQSGKAQQNTLEALAHSSGFLSRSNFVKAFKYNTGKTPSEYLKDMKSGI